MNDGHLSKNPRKRVVVLFSGGASAALYPGTNDPRFCRSCKIVGAIASDQNATGIRSLRAAGIPVQVCDFKYWCFMRGVRQNDLWARQDYFRWILNWLEDLNWRPDFLILSGFMLIVTDPLLEKFSGKILNVHPALLSLLDEKGDSKYTGSNVVWRAMEAGDPTGSTVHLVDSGKDTGPIVYESAPLPYLAGADSQAHQDRMKYVCDGPALATALAKLLDAGWPDVPYSQT